MEFSLRTGESMNVTGWGGNGVIEVPVPSGVMVRVRYIVIDGQPAADTEGDLEVNAIAPEGYLLQIWPAPYAPPEVVASTSPWSQYWTFGPLAADLLTELADVPDPDRLVVVIDRALSAHRDVATHLRAGDTRYRLGILSYLQELFSATRSTNAYQDMKNDYERLYHLIDERAQLLD